MALQDDRKNNADGHCDWEQNLPEFLQESIQAMVSAWDKLDRGEEYYLWDCDYCSLQSDINSAEVNRIISLEQAWYLREKYLRMEREAIE